MQQIFLKQQLRAMTGRVSCILSNTNKKKKKKRKENKRKRNFSYLDKTTIASALNLAPLYVGASFIAGKFSGTLLSGSIDVTVGCASIPPLSPASD
jgi:hypothetical protein